MNGRSTAELPAGYPCLDLGSRRARTPRATDAEGAGGSQQRASICCISTLEIARLAAGGDIILKIPLTDWIERTLTDLRMESIPVSNEIAVEAYRLPEPFHKDPADRQIVACSRLHGLRLATADDRILQWKHVASIDARR